MYESRPIIGIAGGIASGKTHVARLFGELGCMVISSDALVRTAYTHPTVKRAVMDMLGEEVFTPGGEVDRAAVGRAVFGDVEKRKQLEQLLHPIVNQVRLERMRAGAADPAVVAYVWDSPLLFETGLDGLCTAVVFVETPLPIRVARAAERGWDENALARRENVQWPLDKKREKADYIIRNAEAPADADASLPDNPPDADEGLVTEATPSTPAVDASVRNSKHSADVSVCERVGETSGGPMRTAVATQVRAVLEMILGGGACDVSAGAEGGCGQGCLCAAAVNADA